MLKKRQNEVKQNIFLFDEVKKHSRTSPDVQFKEFSLTKQKTRPRMAMSELRKPLLKNQIKKIRKKQKINVKMPHVNKKTTTEK